MDCSPPGFSVNGILQAGTEPPGKHIYIYIYIYPVGEESACNTGDLGLIPGLGRSPGGHGNHSSVLAWRIMDRDWQTTVHGVAESDVTEATEHVRARARVCVCVCVCVCMHTHTHIHTVSGGRYLKRSNVGTSTDLAFQGKKHSSCKELDCYLML